MNILKKLTAVCLAAALMVPVAGAAYEHTDWAKDEVARAETLGLIQVPVGEDLTQPILRGSFAKHADALVAKVLGQDLDTWLAVADFREALGDLNSTGELPEAALANQLGILLGKGGTDLATRDRLTRQEAAVMLGRAYSLYGEDLQVDCDCVTRYADQSQIADWAAPDVALMAHLGIMNGVGDNRFDPLGEYTIEQCIVTVLRLYEKTGTDAAAQDLLQVTAQEKAVAPHWQQGEWVTITAWMRDDGYLAYGTHMSGLPHGDALSEVCYVDETNTFRSFPVDIQTAPGKDAQVQGVRLSEDGTVLHYLVFVPEDVKDANGDLLYASDQYQVDIHLATGEQTTHRINPN